MEEKKIIIKTTKIRKCIGNPKCIVIIYDNIDYHSTMEEDMIKLRITL